MRTIPRYKSFTTAKGAEIYKKDRKDESAKPFLERLKLLERQNVYADNVRELFVPEIDDCKSKEIELRIQKLQNPVIKRVNFEGSPRK